MCLGEEGVFFSQDCTLRMCGDGHDNPRLRTCRYRSGDVKYVTGALPEAEGLS